MSKTIVKIYFNNGCSSVLYKETTSVQEIIKYVLKGRLSQNELRFKKCFQLCANKFLKKNEQIIEKYFWLPYNLKIKETLKVLENDDFDCWKIFLRVRYLPADLNEVKFKDRVTFTYYYEQIKNDFMLYKADLIIVDESSQQQQQQQQTILELGCLEMRRSFQNMKPSVLDKKINFEYLEKDVGLKRFFPDKLLQQVKTKNVKKVIVKGIKDFESSNEEDCMLHYLDKLKSVWRYDEETYECQLGGHWSVPIRVVVNCTDGISCYMTDKREIIQYEKITEINVNNDHDCYLVQLKLNQTEELLTFKFNDNNVACNFALLIDGYCTLKSNQEAHVWSQMNSENAFVNASSTASELPKREVRCNNEVFDDDDDDTCEYAAIDSCNEVDRNKLDFVEKLGSGQFGDVYRGAYKRKNNDVMDVAIKMLKLNNEEEDKNGLTNKFMQEARIMQSFDHPHIIKLIGVCSDHPSLIIMEMAVFGQLRKYLQANVNEIEVSTLIMYCYQLNTAMSYLESKKFVHRDIAARNVLVFSPDCVKLSDFGLSRAIEENFYLASKSKLPIKWLAPESINFRKFTSSSDVWMFAVCMWEILSFGEKPFQSIKNAEVIHLIENKQRMPKPTSCPDELYAIMLRCWEYDPLQRPKFSQLNDVIHSIYMAYKEHKVFIASYTPPKAQIDLQIDEPGLKSTSADAALPPPKPKRISSSSNPSSKFQYPNYVSKNLNETNNIPITNLRISDRSDYKATQSADNIWLDERLNVFNRNSDHQTTKSPHRVLSPSRYNNNKSNTSSPSIPQSTTSSSKEIQLRDSTYSFIQKISAFVHSLSKNNNQQIDLELKTIVYSWNNLCDIYETYPITVTSGKNKSMHEVVEELDNKISLMVDELKSNHLDKVISIALELAHNAKQLFCTIINTTTQNGD